MASMKHGCIGTFCNDGTFTMPLGHPLVLKGTVIIIKYDYSFNFTNTITLKYKYYTDDSFYRELEWSRMVTIISNGTVSFFTNVIIFHDYRIKSTISFTWRLAYITPLAAWVTRWNPTYLVYMQHTERECQNNLSLHIYTETHYPRNSKNTYLKCGEHSTFISIIVISMRLEQDHSWPGLVIGMRSFP